MSVPAINPALAEGEVAILADEAGGPLRELGQGRRTPPVLQRTRGRVPEQPRARARAAVSLPAAVVIKGVGELVSDGEADSAVVEDVRPMGVVEGRLGRWSGRRTGFTTVTVNNVNTATVTTGTTVTTVTAITAITPITIVTIVTTVTTATTVMTITTVPVTTGYTVTTVKTVTIVTTVTNITFTWRMPSDQRTKFITVTVITVTKATTVTPVTPVTPVTTVPITCRIPSGKRTEFMTAV